MMIIIIIMMIIIIIIMMIIIIIIIIIIMGMRLYLLKVNLYCYKLTSLWPLMLKTPTDT